MTMLRAALFRTANTRKQPKSSSTDEWKSKMWYVPTMEYYSAYKEGNSDIGYNMDEP